MIRIAHTADDVIGAVDEARRDSGVTLLELRELSGVSASTVSGWTTGARAPRLPELLRVLEALGLEVVIQHRPRAKK